MTYAYFAPSDLRTVDPRPAPPMTEYENTVRELLRTRLVGERLTDALEALGLQPPRATESRDERARKRVRRTMTTHCRDGHERATHSFIGADGCVRCRTCKNQREQARRKKARA